MPHLLLRLFGDGGAFWILLWGVLGLVWGSFVNVVIYRLPRMMQQQWRSEAREILELPQEQESAARFNLVVPRSACPHCKHRITALENIPVLSYLLLRGRCRGCNAAISCRYPLVELLCALTAMYCAHLFGFGWQAAAASLLSWSLVALAMIDLQHRILPDDITLPLLWLGLLVNLFGLFVPLQDAITGAMAGYLAPWLLYHGYRLLSGKEGMGYGDFKLLAMFGAWMGWLPLISIALLASITGILFALLRAVAGYYRGSRAGTGMTDPIPFGPSLALAGWCVFVFDISILPWHSIGW